MSDIIKNEDGSVTVSPETLLTWVTEKNELIEQLQQAITERDAVSADLYKILTGMQPICKMLGIDSGKAPGTMQLMQMLPKLLNNPSGMFDGIGEVLEKYQHLFFNQIPVKK
ncbi:hypothetical protein QNI19_16520 [Cytophagaceae bacterium DM2B3-1]|uniref:DUF1641 domain-containing protein n=2 Tax=Xanthocytophaga TaxID=3078918 RepID=A0ABT7CLE9_9BACT|nr:MULTISPECIES: hypothetical protein [Xanthocytophaga]MDJ1494551.1 hypothetical protein [Xanthocytophaga flavus]MDJ1505014.1 hypothetical protein [Xanthocytophaga agilis]